MTLTLSPSEAVPANQLRALGLSVRASNCLARRNILSKEAAAHAIRAGSLHPFHGHNALRNFGLKSYLEVCRWSGVIMPEPVSPQSVAIVLDFHYPYPWTHYTY